MRVELVGLHLLQEQGRAAPAVVLPPPLHVARHRRDQAQRGRRRRRHVPSAQRPALPPPATPTAPTPPNCAHYAHCAHSTSLHLAPPAQVRAARLLPAAQGGAAARAQSRLLARPRAHLRRPQRGLRLLPGLRGGRARAVGDRRGAAARELLLQRRPGRVRRRRPLLEGERRARRHQGAAPLGGVDLGARPEALLGRGRRLVLQRAAAPAALPEHAQGGRQLRLHAPVRPVRPVPPHGAAAGQRAADLVARPAERQGAE